MVSSGQRGQSGAKRPKGWPVRRGLRAAWLALLGALAIMQASPALVQADDAAPEAAMETAAWLDSEARLRPSLPVRVSGRWDGELRVVEWEAKLDLEGDAFSGEIRFPHLPVAVPLSVRGKREGDLVEFSVRYAEGEVAYFGGHLAGTSLVGAFEGITGERGQWSGSWVPETLTVEGEAAR